MVTYLLVNGRMVTYLLVDGRMVTYRLVNGRMVACFLVNRRMVTIINGRMLTSSGTWDRRSMRAREDASAETESCERRVASAFDSGVTMHPSSAGPACTRKMLHFRIEYFIFLF